MNPAIAPPTALGAANIIATPAVPADASNPGRARNTHPNIRTLGASPQRRPVTTAPTALNRREKKTIPAVTNSPHTARYAKKTRSLFCHVWSGLITRSVTRRVPITTTSHAEREDAICLRKACDQILGRWERIGDKSPRGGGRWPGCAPHLTAAARP